MGRADSATASGTMHAADHWFTPPANWKRTVARLLPAVVVALRRWPTAGTAVTPRRAIAAQGVWYL